MSKCGKAAKMLLDLDQIKQRCTDRFMGEKGITQGFERLGEPGQVRSGTFW
jgi:hypothetical protein